MGEIKGICISEKRGIQKQEIPEVNLIEGWGLEGDAHGGRWHRQVSLLSYDKITEFRKRGADVDFGAFGENIIVEGIDFSKFQAIITPIEIAGERLGTLFIYKTDAPYDIDDIILCEYGTTVVGLEMLRAVNEENAEESRKLAVVKSAIGTLSFSEMQAIIHIFDELDGMEGVLVASKIADRVGITRSVIVNALRKFESAGVIESRSSGMKGTYIKVTNDVVFNEIKKLKAEM